MKAVAERDRCQQRHLQFAALHGFADHRARIRTVMRLAVLANADRHGRRVLELQLHEQIDGRAMSPQARVRNGAGAHATLARRHFNRPQQGQYPA